jgi:hypothetical protein
VCDKKSKRGINISERCIRPATWWRRCEFVIRRANTMGCNHWYECDLGGVRAARQKRGFARSQTRTPCVSICMPPLRYGLAINLFKRGETLFSSIAISSPLFLFHRALNYFALFLCRQGKYLRRAVFSPSPRLFRFGCDSLLWGRMRDVPGKATFLARTLLPGGLRPTCETNGRPPLHLPLWSSTICHAALY